MGYAATKVVIIYWKLDKTFFIHRSHHVWFDEYNYRLSIEDKHNPGCLILQKDHGIRFHHSDLLNLIPCEIYPTSTSFHDTTIIIYEIELPPSENKVCFNLLDDEYFTIRYITDTIPNSSAGRQLPTQSKPDV